MASSRAVIVTIVVALVLTAAAFGGVYYLRTKNRDAPSVPPTPLSTASTCHVEPCTLLAPAAIGNTRIELWADAGGRSGRLKIDDLLVEVTITGSGAALTPSSLQCVPGTLSACLVHGVVPGGEIGEVVVGRSGKWQATDQPYFSDAGYLALTDVDNNNTPEVVAVQKNYYAQVFQIAGSAVKCTRPVAKLTQLPGWPTVKPTAAQLQPC